MKGGPLAGVPIAGCLGDQQAAMLGQRCSLWQAKNTYGTGCFMLLNTGEEAVASASGLLTTVGYQLGAGAPVCYALEGSVAIAGQGISWLRDRMGFIASARESEAVGGSVPDTAGVYFVPAFGGLLAPWWRDDARGVLVGLTQFTSKVSGCLCMCGCCVGKGMEALRSAIACQQPAGKMGAARTCSGELQ